MVYWAGASPRWPLCCLAQGSIRHVVAQMTEPKPPKGKRRRNTPDDTRRKLDAMLAAKKAEQAKPSGSALVWKDRGVRDASRGGRLAMKSTRGKASIPLRRPPRSPR
jgi:hypothetical protein